MEAARFEVGLSRCIAQQGDFGGKAEVTLNVFFDSSALAKRYIEEKGSDRVQTILSSAFLCVSVVKLFAPSRFLLATRPPVAYP